MIATGDNDTLSVVKNKKFERLVGKGIAEVSVFEMEPLPFKVNFFVFEMKPLLV